MGLHPFGLKSGVNFALEPEGTCIRVSLYLGGPLFAILGHSYALHTSVTFDLIPNILLSLINFYLNSQMCMDFDKFFIQIQLCLFEIKPLALNIF